MIGSTHVVAHTCQGKWETGVEAGEEHTLSNFGHRHRAMGKGFLTPVYF